MERPHFVVPLVFSFELFGKGKIYKGKKKDFVKPVQDRYFSFVLFLTKVFL
jgi:hypothetical protein